MKDYAVLTNDGKYTIFEFNNQRVRFITSDKLERYTKVVEWDNGYLVVMAKYKEMPEVEEYIDLIPILNMLYYDTETFLKPIRRLGQMQLSVKEIADNANMIIMDMLIQKMVII